MKLATTTGDFDFWCHDYMEGVKNVCDAGFRYIDLGMYSVWENDSLLLNEDWRDYAKKLNEYAHSREAQFVQAHSPGGNPLDTGNLGYERLINTTIRSIEVCGELGIPNIVVHAGFGKTLSKEEYFEKNKEFYKKLFPAMEKHNVCVLCENSTAANMGDMYYTNSGADMKSFVEYVDHPLFHACWDTGHANTEGSQYDEIKTVGSDLYAVHIHDNRGACDEHIIPWFGTISMDEVMHALIDSGYKGYFTFEAESSLRKSKSFFGDRRTFNKECRLVEPQLFMQKHLEKFLFEIGVYILKSYNCYEE